MQPVITIVFLFLHVATKFINANPVENVQSYFSTKSKDHLHRQKRGAKVYRLYCPTGGSKELPLYDHEIENGHVMREFERFCQCRQGATCKKDTGSSRFDCSSFIGDVLETSYKVKDACIIHDICYESNRTKTECDNEFHHNFKQLCEVNIEGVLIGGAAGAAAGAGAAVGGAVGGTIAACAIPIINIFACPIALATGPAIAASAGTAAVAGGIAGAASIGSCAGMADIAYAAVRDHGRVRSPRCNRKC